MGVIDFKAEATDLIIDDLKFFTQEAGSKKCSNQGEFSKLGLFNRYSAQSPFPILNGVVMDEPSTVDLTTELVQKQISYFQDQKVPHVWWLLSSEQNKHLGPILENEGYMSGGTYLGYAQKVENIDSDKLPQMPLNSKVVVHEVASDSDYDRFIEVLGQVFGLDQGTVEKYHSLLKPYGQGQVYRHVVAKIDDKVVGIMTAMLRNGWCGSWNGGVLEEARGTGVGRALCLKLKEIGDQEQVEGYSGILMATANAKGLALKFGGEKVCEIYPYLYGIKSEDFEP